MSIVTNCHLSEFVYNILMRTNSKFTLGIHALLMIAYFEDKKITSEDVARSVGCNPVIVRNVFKDLREANLLETKSGKGKTELSKPANKITLWDVYQATESSDPDDIFKMYYSQDALCPIGSNIKGLLSTHFTDAINAMEKKLSKVTIASLINELKQNSDTFELHPELLKDK